MEEKDIRLQEEATHLLQTRQVIFKEKARLEALTGVHEDTIEEVQIPEDSLLDTDVSLRLFLSRVENFYQLCLASHEAYFAHLRFSQNGTTPVEDFYIGRWGVYDPESLQVIVADWRSPIANLYYAGQIGSVNYETPEGHETGILSLKRMLEVREDQIHGIYDTDIIGQEQWLHEALGATTGERMREIVTTIQAEQNQVIRAPITDNMIVQGAAGSGKTSIALHRVAYLLYVHRQEIRPEYMMILAPSPLFLSYISQVLPELGVERVRQWTWEGLVSRLLGKSMPKVFRSVDRMSMRITEREEKDRVLRRKGSLAMKECLEAYLQDLSETMLPASDFTFGNQTVMTHEEVRTLFLRQLSSWPLQKRITEAAKSFGKRLHAIADQMKETMQSMAERRFQEILRHMPQDSPERQARVGKLFASRDQRIVEIEEKEKQAKRDFLEAFGDLRPLSVYRDYITSCEDAYVQIDTVPLLEKGYVSREDLAALLLIQRSVSGWPRERMRHIVVDECQDASPFQMAVLHMLYPGATMTLTGDLCQGIHAASGIEAYSQWDDVFQGKLCMRELVQSYRSTVEIVEAAQSVLRCFPIPGIRTAVPVPRHGEAVQLRVCANTASQDTMICELITHYQECGLQTIVILSPSRKVAKALCKRLEKQVDVSYQDGSEQVYQGGVQVFPAEFVKGMEFDAAILCDVNEETYLYDAFHAHMLYMLMTRPLHALAICSVKRFTPLLKHFD